RDGDDPARRGDRERDLRRPPRLRGGADSLADHAGVGLARDPRREGGGRKMKVRESFTIDEPRSSLWEFFERVDQVAACVPGVEKVEVIDDDNSRIQVTQAVGPLTSTFDLKMRITERKPEELMRFTTIGRAVKGAAGNVRATNSVSLEESEGRTRVGLEADLAMGGMLGSVRPQ